jgi:hypothetical protein
MPMLDYIAVGKLGGSGVVLPPPPTPEILHWPCDDGAGSTVTAAVGTNGTWSGTPTWQAVGHDGASGSAISCDGSSGAPYVTSSSSVAHGGATAVTVAYWVRFAAGLWTAPAATPTWFSRASPGGSNEDYWIDGSAAGINVYAHGAGGPTIYSSYTFAGALAAITSGVWYHFLWYIDAGNDPGSVDLYVDGSLVTPDASVLTGHTVSAGFTDATAYVMAHNAVAANRFFGDLEDIRIYNRALTPTEIASLAAS